MKYRASAIFFCIVVVSLVLVGCTEGPVGVSDEGTSPAVAAQTLNFAKDPKFFGQAIDIGCAPTSVMPVWVIKSDGFVYYRSGSWSSGSYVRDPLAPVNARRVGVGMDGTQPMVVTNSKQIYKRGTTGSWTLFPSGLAVECALGDLTKSPSMWVIGTAVAPIVAGAPQGNSIYYWQIGSGWIRVAGGASKISVNPPDNQPWVVDSRGGVFKRNANGTWVSHGLPYRMDISTAGDAEGDVWAVETFRWEFGSPIYTGNTITVRGWNGNWEYTNQNIGALQIAARRSPYLGGTRPWIISANGYVYTTDYLP